MSRVAIERAALEQLEHDLEEGQREGALAAMAWLASNGMPTAPDEDAVHGACRRALLLLAVGGDPRSGLLLDGRAACSLAVELESMLSWSDLRTRLEQLRPLADDLPLVAAALDELAADASLARRALACALLAEELEE